MCYSPTIAFYRIYHSFQCRISLVVCFFMFHKSRDIQEIENLPECQK